MEVHIVEVNIRQFRAIEASLALKFLHPSGGILSRVIIAGPNGGGKTSLLEGILLALGHEDLIVRDLPAAERGDHWRVEIPQGGEVELRCQLKSKQLSLVPRFNHLEEFIVSRTADRWEIRWKGDSGKEYSVSNPDEVRKVLSEYTVEYFSSWRAPILPGGVQPTSRGRPPHDNEANRLRRLKQRIINERARRAFEADPNQAHDEFWLDRLNVVWKAFHRDESFIDAGIVDPNAEEPFFDLFVIDGATRRCSIDQVSSGELELLSLAGTLILSQFDGLLIIDEPELHLHREWQGQLVDALKEMAPDAQMILATHADAPWDQAYSFERFFLSRPDDPRASSMQVDNSGRGA